MLLIILALFWVALLAPVVVRRLRDGGTEKSIASFHHEHEALSRQDYTVAPAHRLDEPDESAYVAHDRRARLTVVHADDTYGSLESRTSWEEWSRDYDYEEPARHTAPEGAHRYAAYSTPPVEREDSYRTHDAYRAPEQYRRRSMRSQRRMMFGRLLLGTIVLTLVAFVAGVSIIEDLAYVAWLMVAAYVGLAAFAVWQGLLSAESVTPGFLRRRDVASVEPLYGETPGRSRAREEAREPLSWGVGPHDLDADYEDADPTYAAEVEEWSFPERRRAIG